MIEHAALSPHDFSPGDLQRVPAPPREGLREPEARSVHAYTTAEVRAVHDLPIPDLVLRAQLGWWWADPIAAIGIAALAAREGYEMYTAEDICC